MVSQDKGNLGRRRFFRDAMARIILPAAEYIERHVAAPPERTHVRPPGAIDEPAFLDTCTRCGACADVCPAGAILRLGESEEGGAGTPVIDADLAACTLCDKLACTTTCPSGALQPLKNRHLVRMGLAEVYASVCLRGQSKLCGRCVEKCPLGAAAIHFVDSGPPEVLSPGCVGCGLCQYHCPTTPKAITVKPLG